jgi:tRNA dimethylallyltransferase
MTKLIVIVGQTATGKTKLALELAQKHNGEIINFDSRQIYKYLDIITGKDLPAHKPYIKIETGVEASGIPTACRRPFGSRTLAGKKTIQAPFQFDGIWLYDVVTPDQYFSSFDFVNLASPIIKNIVFRGKIPILVGGTYLYLKHLLYGFDEKNVPPNFKLRNELNSKTVSELQNILKKFSPQIYYSLNQSDVNNPRRLIRKIEVVSSDSTDYQLPITDSTDLTDSDKLHPITSNFIRFHPKIIGLKFKDKSKLRKVIIKRIENRLKNGAIDEVKKLLKMGYKASDPGMKTIGYQQVIKYLNDEQTLEKSIEDWVNKEVQYAKRQLTFMKKDKNINWKEI